MKPIIFSTNGDTNIPCVDLEGINPIIYRKGTFEDIKGLPEAIHRRRKYNGQMDKL